MDTAYMESLDHSIQQANDERNLISFTMEEFLAYTPKKDAGDKLPLLSWNVKAITEGNDR